MVRDYAAGLRNVDFTADQPGLISVRMAMTRMRMSATQMIRMISPTHPQRPTNRKMTTKTSR